MIALSVNLNKIAWLRNARGRASRPNIIAMADKVMAADAGGITLHPRPDLRHVTPDDVYRLADWLASKHRTAFELNLEGNPFSTANAIGYPGFLELVKQVRPQQCTLVPDSDSQLTSDHGFSPDQFDELQGIFTQLNDWGVRSSVFMDPLPELMEAIAKAGANRIELYTGPYAEAFETEADGQLTATCKMVWQSYADTTKAAAIAGLGVNAGHDLDQINLGHFLAIGNIVEVSIGHALIADALEYGLTETISRYLQIISAS